MIVKKSKGFKLSMSGSARQVALLCHGGWSAKIFRGGKTAEGDGYTVVPSGTLLHFYTSHGVYTSGGKTAQAILSDQANSYGGLKQTDPGTPGWKIEFSIQCQESVGGATKGLVQIYNYSLSPDDRGAAGDLFEQHADGSFGSDIDLMIVEKSKEPHLSDAFAACKSAHGSYYEVMHYCPCRYVSSDDTVSMLSV